MIEGKEYNPSNARGKKFKFPAEADCILQQNKKRARRTATPLIVEIRIPSAGSGDDGRMGPTSPRAGSGIDDNMEPTSPRAPRGDGDADSPASKPSGSSSSTSSSSSSSSISSSSEIASKNVPEEQAPDDVDKEGFHADIAPPDKVWKGCSVWTIVDGANVAGWEFRLPNKAHHAKKHRCKRQLRITKKHGPHDTERQFKWWISRAFEFGSRSEHMTIPKRPHVATCPSMEKLEFWLGHAGFATIILKLFYQTKAERLNIIQVTAFEI